MNETLKIDALILCQCVIVTVDFELHYAKRIAQLIALLPVVTISGCYTSDLEVMKKTILDIDKSNARFQKVSDLTRASSANSIARLELAEEAMVVLDPTNFVLHCHSKDTCKVLTHNLQIKSNS